MRRLEDGKPTRKITAEAQEEARAACAGREPPPRAGARLAAQATQRMPHVDERLLAIVRGEVDPEEEAAADDPFGGLIPVDDDGEPLDLQT